MKNKIIVVIGAVVIVVLILGLYLSGYFIEPYWETETNFGKWQGEIIIEYEDGTVQSLKILEDGVNLPLSVKYNGVSINKIYYKVYAVASGTGYTGVEVDISNLAWRMDVLKSSGATARNFNWPGVSEIKSGSLDQQIIIANIQFGASEINNNPAIYPSGSYTIKWIPSGSVSYRGIGTTTSDWQVANTLPDVKSVVITVEQTAPAEITLGYVGTVSTS